MLALWNYLNNLKYILTHDEEGQGMVEYALIIVLIAIVVIVALTALGGGIGNVFERITNQVESGS